MDPLVSIIVPVWNQEELVLRALRSIPRREDIEIVVVDDGSTDGTVAAVESIMGDFTNIMLIRKIENTGIGVTKNLAYEHAHGKYIYQLDSDDYILSQPFCEVIDTYLNGNTDMIYVNCEVNSCAQMIVTQESKRGLCAGFLRFIRREFIGTTRCRPVRAAEDYFFNEDLLAKNPTEIFTGKCVYHYNFPRAGSLFDRMVKGESLEP